MSVHDYKLLSRTSAIIFILFITILLLPVICSGIGMDEAEKIARMSESNPYQTLVYVLGLMCVLCTGALGYVYHQNITNVRDQYKILNDLSNNIENHTEAMNKSHETISKAIEKMNDRPCILGGGDILKELIKK